MDTNNSEAEAIINRSFTNLDIIKHRKCLEIFSNNLYMFIALNRIILEKLLNSEMEQQKVMELILRLGMCIAIDKIPVGSENFPQRSELEQADKNEEIIPTTPEQNTFLNNYIEKALKINISHYFEQDYIACKANTNDYYDVYYSVSKLGIEAVIDYESRNNN